MAYTNKFKDRNPCIATAGFSQYKKNENVENCLIFPVLDTLPTELKIKPSFDLGAYSLPPLKTDVYEGVNTKMRELINPPLKNMSQNLRQELDETVYDSYWNKGLGKIRSLDLPEKLDKYTTCFGKKTVFGESVKELVNPDKTPGQVITESDIGHDLYVKTHNDYYPGEQADRRYNNPPLNKNLIWGEKITSDPEGGCTKKVLKWFDQNNLTAVNEIQARYKCFSQPQVGKVFAPNQNITCVPKHHTFGKLLKRELFGVGDLMRDCAPSQDKIDLSEELVHINLLRNTIRKRVPSFPYRDFLQSLIFEDKGNSGWIPLPTLYDICTFYGIQADRTKLNALLFRLGILSQDGMVKYKDFAAVINVNSIFPPLAKLNDIPPEFLSYETTYKEATKSKKRHFKGLPIAGLPSWWTVRHNLNSETSMEAVMSPNIFTQYGLSHRDFFRPRSREYINELFKRIGVCLPTEMFHQIYDIAKQQDATGGVCIETFRNLLDKQATKNFKLNNN